MTRQRARQRRHADYQIRDRLEKKLPEPTVCPECGAVYGEGRWRWATAPGNAHEVLCPACARVAHDLPAGIVSITGEFADAHREEILGLVDNIESREKDAHPLKRVMDIARHDGGIAVTTTEMHLARSIGEALHSAYEGDLEYHFVEDTNVLRVNWSR